MHSSPERPCSSDRSVEEHAAVTPVAVYALLCILTIALKLRSSAAAYMHRVHYDHGGGPAWSLHDAAWAISCDSSASAGTGKVLKSAQR